MNPPATPSTEPPAVNIRVQPRWQVLAGFAYGFSQPTMLGHVEISKTTDTDLSGIDAAMRFWNTEPLPDGAPADAAGAWTHRLLHWQAALQRQVRIPVFAPGGVILDRKSQSGRETVFHVAIPTHAPRASLESLGWLTGVLTGLQSGASLDDLRQSHQQLLEKLRSYRLDGVNNYHFLHAAHRLDIPALEVTPATYRFGHGAHARWLQSTTTDATSAIGTSICASKSRTVNVLRQKGLPVPKHSRVENADAALEMAEQLGYPVVIKPDDREQGEGVQSGLKDATAVRLAYASALQHSKKILVEKHHEGQDYRLTVYRDRVVKIVHRRAGGIVGDGVSTVAELLKAEQASHYYQEQFRRHGVMKLSLDDEAASLLKERGYSTQTVPPAGEFTPLRRRNNISVGGTQVLIDPQTVHPDNLDLAIRATRAVLLDLCGLDLISPDLTRSWLETGAVIIEMNARPQIGIAAAPDLYRDLLQLLVPTGGRIPLQLLICPSPPAQPEISRLLQLAQQGSCQAVSCIHGVWVHRRQISGPAISGFHAARVLLMQDEVQSGMVVMTAQEIVRYGLPADRFTRIMVVEDRSIDETARTQLAAALRMTNHHVVQGPDGRSAGRAFQAGSAKP